MDEKSTIKDLERQASNTIAKILDEQEVRLTQEQWFYLMTLGGKQLA